MKSSPLIGFALLAIGVAAGWYARGIADGPAPVREGRATSAEPARVATTTTAPAVEEPQSASRGKRAIRETKAESKQEREDANATVFAESQMRKMMDSMAQRQRARLDQHVERLNASLSLSPEQQGKLTAWLDENTKNAGEFDVMAMTGDPEKAYEAQTQFSPEGMEKYLAGLLTPDQKGALDEFQQRNKQGKVDALALKNLAQIQKVVDFTDGQRDQVYQVLSTAAERKLSEGSPTEKMMSFMHESMGIETDPYDLGLDDIMEGAFKGTESTEESTAEPSEDFGKMLNEMTIKNIREELEHRINQKADLLRPVLNEKQLEQYRTELRTRGGGFVEQMIMGLEMSQDESQDTFIIRNRDK